VADNQANINLSDFKNDLSLAGGDVEWADVLNKHDFFTVSYNDLTDKPSIEEITGPDGPQGREGPPGP
jgi:hypothetical protein